MRNIKRVTIAIDPEDPNFSLEFKEKVAEYGEEFIELILRCSAIYATLDKNKDRFLKVILESLQSTDENSEEIMGMTKEKIVDFSIEFYDIIYERIKKAEDGEETSSVVIEDVSSEEAEELLERVKGSGDGIVGGLIDEETISNDN